MHIERLAFGTFYNQSVNQITLSNDNGMSVSILELGGIITQLNVPNADGEIADVVLGFDSLPPYIKYSHYFGALIGRVANRIEGAQFELQGETIKVDGNAYQGKHCVHGGRFGYHRRVWKETETEQKNSETSITFKLLDADGEEGFQHNIVVLATYTLSNSNTLALKFNAYADGVTPVNITAHSYFNLYGHQAGSIKNHKLTIFANKLLEQKEDRIPNGNIIALDRSDFCFQKPKRLNGDVERGLEINHSYVFNHSEHETGQLKKMARLEGDGRVLTIFSNEKTLHFYNGHNLDGVDGKEDVHYPRYAGLCLEPKGFVNGINEANFPCTVIDPSKNYLITTEPQLI
ncbi:galactose mutarotase [Photobacterium sp. ZSDE20]|uniref:Aldose 1-epimerase n=1 Tax=Photobacterium pectinilyticum TaxID=2906793 RepID=A0ABT1N815_9GAMM|nr:aldose epimerase family protein [Photobacterium sp. ZSDE20]MCQ1059816.1 galactose mutarotase [Photobacterium sp. ZSDE20]